MERPIRNLGILKFAFQGTVPMKEEGSVGHGIRWMPQVHWQVHARFQIQAGFGLRHLNGETSPEAATRLIAEF